MAAKLIHLPASWQGSFCPSLTLTIQGYNRGMQSGLWNMAPALLANAWLITI
jgi:hypothetical protein